MKQTILIFSAFIFVTFLSHSQLNLTGILQMLKSIPMALYNRNQSTAANINSIGFIENKNHPGHGYANSTSNNIDNST